MKLTLFLAKKFLYGSRDRRSFSVMVKICFAGIFIGTFALTLVAAIMNGFEHATYEKLQGIHADLIIKGYGQALNFEKIAHVINKEFANFIDGVSPTSLSQIIIRNPKTELSRLIAIKAFDPRLESKVKKFDQKLINGLKKLGSGFFIGKKLQEDLEINVGDQIDFLYADAENIKSKKVELEKFSDFVTGIFDTGVDDFDANVALMSYDLFSKIFTDIGVSEINVKLKNRNFEKMVQSQLKSRLSLDVFSWKDLYPAIVAALVLEKYVSFFILALISLVASMNLVALIYMYINSKKAEIAILASMGMDLNQIRKIFLLIGFILTATASALGIAFAFIGDFILNRYPFIKLPDIYYVTTLPSKLDFTILIWVIITVLIFGLIASWLPTLDVKKMSIANILKFQG